MRGNVSDGGGRWQMANASQAAGEGAYFCVRYEQKGEDYVSR